jgi:hypothetical protein
MNSNQWFFLGVALIGLGWFFIQFDANSGNIPFGKVSRIVGNHCDIVENINWKLFEEGKITEDEWIDREQERMLRPLRKPDIKCAVGEEMYEPFIYLTQFGFIICFIMSYWESRKKKH